ncbi:MAG TPA: 7-cyano-7-deazaguanine synthase, partial [Rhizobiales bacterium]|nr:7-cyano-7-deazaguanine synthase [Hyphomicrobiales bacterium]
AGIEDPTEYLDADFWKSALDAAPKQETSA